MAQIQVALCPRFVRCAWTGINIRAIWADQFQLTAAGSIQVAFLAQRHQLLDQFQLLLFKLVGSDVLCPDIFILFVFYDNFNSF